MGTELVQVICKFELWICKRLNGARSWIDSSPISTEGVRVYKDKLGGCLVAHHDHLDLQQWARRRTWSCPLRVPAI